MAPSKKKIKLSKLRSFRHEEDYDQTYVNTFNTIHNQFDRISESSVNYEDGENFQALPRDFEGFDENDFQALPRNFEGFDENDSVNFKEYTDRFVDMFLQGEAEEDERQDEIILDLLELIPKPLEDFHEDKAEEKDDEIVYFVIEKSSRNGKDMVTDTWGFNYSSWRETGFLGRCKHFRCTKRHAPGKIDCPVVLKIYKYNENDMKVIKTNKHNHHPDFSLNIKREINMALKRECMDNTLDNPSAVIHNVLLNNEDYMNFYEKGSSLAKMKSMKMTIMRTRNLHAPPKVTNINFQLERRFFPQDVPHFFRGDVTTKEGRHVIFFSDKQLEYLQKAKVWYVDGTFKIIRDPFTQLLTIHTTVRNNETTSSIPIAFILMSRRRKIDYLAIFKKIIEIIEKETGKKTLVSKIMADFEIALWQAIRNLKETEYLPGIEMKGCFFHFCQATYRKVMSFNLKKDYFNPKDSGTRTYIKWLMSLPLLPEQQMREAFSELEKNMKDRRCTNLKHLLTYFKNNWIDGRNWSAKDICVYKQKIRTNNDAEKFHNNLNYQIQKTNISFYPLVDHLAKQAQWIPLQIQSLINNQLSPIKTAKQKKFEDLLEKNYKKLDNSKLSPIQFLHEMNQMKYTDDFISEEWSLNFSRIDLQPEEEDLQEEGAEGLEDQMEAELSS